MGESKRRKQLDPNYGKQRSFASNNKKVPLLFQEKGQWHEAEVNGKQLLAMMLSKMLYKHALEHDFEGCKNFIKNSLSTENDEWDVAIKDIQVSFNQVCSCLKDKDQLAYETISTFLNEFQQQAS